MHTNPELTQGPILVGIDFSQLSKSIVEYAVKLALQELRPLHFVYVMPIVTDDSPDLLRIQELELEEYVNAAQQKLQGTASRSKALSSSVHLRMRLFDLPIHSTPPASSSELKRRAASSDYC